MDTIARKTLEMYHKVIGALSPTRAKSTLLTLFGMLLRRISSTLNSMFRSAALEDETKQLKAKCLSKSEEMASLSSKIDSQDATIENQKEQLKSAQTNEVKINKEHADQKLLNDYYRRESRSAFKRLSEARGTLELLERQFADLTLELERKKEHIANTSRIKDEEIQSLTQKIRKRDDDDRKDYTLEIESNTAKLKEQQIYLNGLKETSQSCLEREQTACAELETLKKRKQEANNELSTKQERVKSLEKNLNALKQKQTTDQGDTS